MATSSFAPYIGGVEEHVRHVAGVLREEGHDVVVWTVERSGGFAVRQVDDIEVWDLPAPLPARSVRDLVRFAAAFPRALRSWRRAFRSARPEVVHIHCFGPNGTYASLLSRLARIPFIVTSHGETLADDGGVFDASMLARASLRRALARAGAVTACSHVVLDDLEARFELPRGTGVIVPNGIDPHEVEPELVPGLPRRYIAAVGRLQRVKGFDLLVDAFAAAELPQDVGLVIGGDGPEAGVLRERADALGLGTRLVLPGRLRRAQVAALFDGAAAVAVPSRFEAFGIVALEAWRAGAPLIITDHGGPPEFVRDGVDGVIVTPEDVASFAEALGTVVHDPERARALGLRGAERLPQFSWRSVAAAYADIAARLRPA